MRLAIRCDGDCPESSVAPRMTEYANECCIELLPVCGVAEEQKVLCLGEEK